MKENVDKHIEQLVDKAMKQSALETPTFGFTTLVMEEVAKVKVTSLTTTYEPLIYKRGWLAVFSVFIGFVMYAIWISSPEDPGLFDKINLNFLSNINISEIFKGIHLSSIARNSILMFGLMFLIQIPLLKYYFDKRILN